jgi:hypothetical protein
MATTIIINERSTGAKKMIEYLRTQSYVKIINDESTKISKAEFMDDFRKSLAEVKAKKTKPLKELFNGK